ncbi:MAG: DUF1573 domain-containing protein [Candidatus Cryptobacteroides sp.]
MKRCLGIIFCLAVALVSAINVTAQIRLVPSTRLDSIACPPKSPDAAFLKLDSTNVSLGNMTSGDSPATVRLRMSNTGTGVLDIDRITTSCSCVSAVSDRTVIKPGESARLRVTFNPKGHFGHQTYRVQIYTGGYADPSAILDIKVHVSD